ncbi:putative mitochondrial protein AtMg00860 [Nicotiana tabacum]|uniref:Mitochondrial protein AtMg00860 n=1 Tax=Nicotiana tabacum TaxID=4097 RepID=A0AC58TQP2_TOBAC
MDQQKIQAITNWPPPKDIHALKAFFGLCNFYRRFVKNYSLIAVPLAELLKKVTPWEWGPKRAGAFNALKAAMSSSPVLALPDLAKPFEVQIDAYDYALGGVLLQEGNPVAYKSRKLKDAERRYAAHEKELLCLGSKLSHSSSFHPQFDGQMERFNGMLEEYLRHFVTGS